VTDPVTFRAATIGLRDNIGSELKAYAGRQIDMPQARQGICAALVTAVAELEPLPRANENEPLWVDRDEVIAMLKEVAR
jgi:hypothetical protein